MVKDQKKSKLVGKTSSEERMEKLLMKIKSGQGGSVSYIFISERFDKDSNPIQVRSFLQASIQPEVFYKLENNKKVNKSLTEVLEVFKSTMIDLGATEFIID